MIDNFNLAKRDNLVKIVEEEGEEEVTIKLEDYLQTSFNYCAENKQIITQMKLRVPTNLSSTQKGCIGEKISKLILDMNREDPELLTEAQKPGSPYDILDILKGLRYDAKFSLIHTDKKTNRKYWQFCLEGDRKEKDYKTEVDYLILIGDNPEPEGQPVLFIIPTTEDEVVRLSSIEIPISRKSKYMRFIYNLEGGDINEATNNHSE